MKRIILAYRGMAENEEDEADMLWVDRTSFDIGMSVIILLNTLVISLETDLGDPTSKDREIYWICLEALFCVCFVVEIGLKVYYHSGKWIILGPANFLTFLIAVVAVIEAAILNPLGHNGTLRVVSLFRVMGLVRLRHAVRRFRFLEELRLVFQGLVDSLKTIFWTMILMFVLLYVCSVYLTKEIGHNAEKYANYYKMSGGWDHQAYFGTIGKSMYTLLQVVTLDSWSSKIARHVINN